MLLAVLQVSFVFHFVVQVNHRMIPKHLQMIAMGVLVHRLVTVNIVQRKEIVKMKNRLLKKILIAVMECVFILACCFVVLVVFCMWLFSHTGI